jgi:uncharacterized NAD(P)/FAD-binding protein YdhS
VVFEHATAERAGAERFDAAVIGGGFAGTMVAVQVARLAKRPLRIVMFDRAGAFGRGAAYGPASDECLLNVRAKAMGAFPDAEGDFLHWLRDTGYADDDRDLGERFLPRRLYGEYLRELLDRAAESGVLVEKRPAHVNELAAQDEGYLLKTVCGSEVSAGAVVLAIGNLPSRGLGGAPVATAWARYARNAWELLASEPLPRDADVLIVGTGLSALDVLAQLSANAHRGRITMVSRHGRFPLAHAPPARRPALVVGPIDGTPRDVIRAVRRLVADATQNGRSWHDVIDALRPQLNAIWQRWTLDEQRRFDRHAAPIWEVHRHRAPPAVLAVRDALLAAGQLHVRRGSLCAMTATGIKYQVSYQDRERQAEVLLEVDVVVDCTGPRRDLAKTDDALIDALLTRRLATPGPLGIGLAAGPDGALGEAGGRTPIFALGTPLRGTLCESSAVREIRVQALRIAESIVAASERANEAAS